MRGTEGRNKEINGILCNDEGRRKAMMKEETIRQRLEKQVARYIEREKDGSFERAAQTELWYHIESLALILDDDLEELKERIRKGMEE